MYEAEYDADGVLIPELWRPIRRKWDALPLTFRQKRSSEYVAELAKVKPEREYRRPAKRFTTDYAIRFCRRFKDWKLLQREQYDPRTKRHKDLPLGSDAMFETPEGIVFVQGAGRSERSDHWKRFQERGGFDRLSKMSARFLYLEFERSSADPIKVEWWQA